MVNNQTHLLNPPAPGFPSQGQVILLARLCRTISSMSRTMITPLYTKHLSQEYLQSLQITSTAGSRGGRWKLGLVLNPGTWQGIIQHHYLGQAILVRIKLGQCITFLSSNGFGVDGFLTGVRRLNNCFDISDAGDGDLSGVDTTPNNLTTI